MKLLAMDTSTWVLAVGVMEDGQLLGELNTNIKKNHSLRLMPAVERLLDELELAPRDLDGMAVAHGPGSYTGVRIGLTTAKTMAWGLKIPIVGISSLQVIAQNRAGFEGQIVPLLDARRKQVYTGRYTYDEDRHMVVPAVKDRIQPLDEWLVALKKESEPLLFIGTGVDVYQRTIKEVIGTQAHFAAVHEHLPRGSQLAYLAWRMWENRVHDAHHYVPQYLQLAEAEQKWLQKK